MGRVISLFSWIKISFWLDREVILHKRSLCHRYRPVVHGYCGCWMLVAGCWLLSIRTAAPRAAGTRVRSHVTLSPIWMIAFTNRTIIIIVTQSQNDDLNNVHALCRFTMNRNLKAVLFCWILSYRICIYWLLVYRTVTYHTQARPTIVQNIEQQWDT